MMSATVVVHWTLMVLNDDPSLEMKDIQPFAVKIEDAM
jgi:hypothetical protein